MRRPPFQSSEQREPGPPREGRRQGHQRNLHQPHQRRGDGSPEISVVIPLLNERDSLNELYGQLRSVLAQATGGGYEIIFVDDGSTDGSFEVIRGLRQHDNRVKCIRFRRNYGKSAALAVGFDHAHGSIIVTMDADLQDDPEEIPNLVARVRDSADMVSGWKKLRHDPITKTLPSKFFNFVVSRMTGIRLHDFNCGLKAYRAEAAHSLEIYGEMHRFLPVLSAMHGFKVDEVVVNHRPRKFGKSKFGAARFMRGFLDLLTVLFTTRYIKRPLHLFGTLGAVLGIAGFGIDLWVTVEKFVYDVPLSNRPISLLGVLLIIVGVQLVSIGLLAELIVRNTGQHEAYSVRDILL
jgi:glycosyltransferase involved in cell wall biosynthesis